MCFFFLAVVLGVSFLRNYLETTYKEGNSFPHHFYGGNWKQPIGSALGIGEIGGQPGSSGGWSERCAPNL